VGRKRMSYRHEVFISYRRSDNIGLWVKRHLHPRLESRLNEISPDPVDVFCDFEMKEGVNWPLDLKKRIRTSKLLLPVWSADYFRSAWCMAEWESFRGREARFGLASEDEPMGLIYPIKYADGKYFHPDANVTMCRKDFSALSYPEEGFRDSPKYMLFDDLIREIADDIVEQLDIVPDWESDFPVVEVPPLPPVRMERPLI
jgi:hypothetical protein